MNLFSFLLILSILISNRVKSQRVLHNNNNNRYYNSKIYFPGKTNADEVNLKRLNTLLSTGGIREIYTNFIEDDSEVEQRSASKIKHFSILKTVRGKIRDVHTNVTPFIVSFLDKVVLSSTEKPERERHISSTSSPLSSERKTANRTYGRIPPPSVLASATSTLRVCEIKYAEYIQRIFPQESDIASDANDAELNGRILAAPGEYPHMAAIGFRSYDGKMDYKCGGSLISENFVITAAHCTNFTGLQPTKVRIGDLNLMVEESYLDPQLHNIKNIYVHPDYKVTSHYNDIALLELQSVVHLTEFVRPIRLWTKETLPFSTAFAMGYGSTDFAKERTNRLTNLNMTIVPNEECNREMPKLPQTDKGVLWSQICARDYALNRDTCQGDSGGPLQLNLRGRKRKNRLHYHLIGITSYGLYCRSGYPSIFTRVCSYLDWIEHIVWKDYFV